MHTKSWHNYIWIKCLPMDMLLRNVWHWHQSNHVDIMMTILIDWPTVSRSLATTLFYSVARWVLVVSLYELWTHDLFCSIVLALICSLFKLNLNFNLYVYKPMSIFELLWHASVVDFTNFREARTETAVSKIGKDTNTIFLFPTIQ